MNYFEVKDRLESLLRFRTLYVEYIGFTNREENPAARIIRQKMEPLAPITVESLRQVGLGGMVTRDAPAHGGRKIRINLIKAIFRDLIIRRFTHRPRTARPARQGDSRLSPAALGREAATVQPALLGLSDGPLDRPLADNGLSRCRV